jgi:Xaa-Pro dipeptidase
MSLRVYGLPSVRGADFHELDLHLSFLKGAQIAEDAAPYGSIVAVNERGRILHYQYKKTVREPSFSLLIDAGSRFRGYPSDITRTYAGPRASRAFCDLLRDVDLRQQQFVDKLALGTSFVEMHQLAHHGLAQILVDHEIIRGLTPEAAVSNGLTRVFFPHGLGHHLGIQVHDVGSKQLDPEGTEIKVASDVPGGRYLRNIRPLAEGHVVTIEPGIYFIPMLLNEATAGQHGSHLNQALIRDLMPHGGIRIEDDIYMTSQGPLNLTRRAFETWEKG